MATNNEIFMKVLLLMCLCLQFLCNCFVISGDGCTCMDIERNALLAFKEDLEDPLGMLSSWDAGVDCCEWQGIECHVKTGRVISLNLRDQGFNFNGVRGNKLNSSLVNLKDLRYLDLSGNNFEGIPIPSFIGSFKRLRYLNLSGSSFTGEVPSQHGNLYENLLGNGLNWIYGLSYLKYLDLSDIDLSKGSKYWLETINTTLPYLVELHLSNCMLSMEKLPKTLGNLCDLRTLILHGNPIRGGIGELMDGFSTCNTSRLEILDLSECDLGGFLPNSLGYLSNLKYLNLGTNSFVGNIPKSIGNLTSLLHFLVSENQLNGSIPESLGKLSSLSILDLSYNLWNSIITERHFHNLSSLIELHMIFGTDIPNNEYNLTFDITLDWTPPFKLERLQIILCQVGPRFPTWLRNQHKLKHLRLHFAMLSGTIPDWFLNLGLSLYSLDLSFNNLSGKVPNTFDFEEGAEVDLSKNHFEGPLPQFASPNISVLSLSDNMFYGMIPHNIFQLMPKLMAYHVSKNHLSGSLPSFMGNLSYLYELFLSKNNITGAIPSSICSLKLLRFLSLSNNNLDGEIPSSMGNLSSLSLLDLSNNNLVGEIPSSMGNLSSLNELDLNKNNLVGEIPSLLSNMSRLSFLDLSNNNFVGEIHSWMGKMSSLQFLLLNNNKISGAIPSSIGNLTLLNLLKLSNNNLVGMIPPLQKCMNILLLDLADNMFSGQIPSWMGLETMQSLLVLKLRSNQLIGHIPKQLCTLSRLYFLDLAHNHLSGTIPPCIGNLTALTDYSNAYEFRVSFTMDMEIITKGTESVYNKFLYLVSLIDLSVNNLTGDIPKEITHLSQLWSLNLSMNHLTGRIPDEIGSLTMLETLDLSLNRLSGMLPPSLAHITSLNHLNLSYNNFEGRIPIGSQLQTLIDPSIYMNNPRLCGTPLTINCPGDVNNPTPPVIVVDDEDNDKIEWRCLLASKALGFTVGFWGFLGPLVVKQSWRRAYFGFVEDKLEAVLIGVARLRIKLIKFSNRN